MSHYIVLGIYGTILTLLAVFGFHRSLLLYLFKKNQKNKVVPKNKFDELPKLTIQLPMFNEYYVAPRLIEAVSGINYPKDKLEIQVLDDSTDETVNVARKKVEEIKQRGIDIVYIHRDNRQGYKAGALENGLKTAKGDFIAIFDADFIPPADIINNSIHYFTDSNIGMVQMRWGHVNSDYSLLTKIESLMLDGHFIIEHTARHRSGRFFNFNGTAGIWRKSAIIDAGGWEHDTLTEDMDLSYRAQLKGWKFVYLPELITPAEIPVEMNSFKSQQHRWAKGSLQVARKILPVILKSDVPLKVKLETVFHLTNNVAYLFLLILTLLLLPNILVREPHGWSYIVLFDIPLFLGTTVSIGIFYIMTYLYAYPENKLRNVIWKIPLLMALGIGLSINQSKAVLEGIFGHESSFVRTPKHGVETKSEKWNIKKYRGSKHLLIPAIEILFGIYTLITVIYTVKNGHWMALPSLILFVIGFFYVGILSLHQNR